MTLQIRIGNKKAKCEVVGDQAAGVGLPSKADPQRISNRDNVPSLLEVSGDFRRWSHGRQLSVCWDVLGQEVTPSIDCTVLRSKWTCFFLQCVSVCACTMLSRLQIACRQFLFAWSPVPQSYAKTLRDLQAVANACLQKHSLYQSVC